MTFSEHAVQLAKSGVVGSIWEKEWSEPRMECGTSPRVDSRDAVEEESVAASSGGKFLALTEAGALPRSGCSRVET